MKVKKVIPLLAMVLANSACGPTSPAQSSAAPESDEEISSSLSSEASVSTLDPAVALQEAKTAARTFLDGVDTSLYEGEELEQINTLTQQLIVLLATATTAEEINEKVQAFRDYLSTAKTKADHEAERAAAALAEAKVAAQDYLETCDPALYEGDELTQINALIAEINGLLETATTAEQVNAKVQELKDYLATAKTIAQHQADAQALADAKAAAQLYLTQVPKDDFEGDEYAHVLELMEELRGLINTATAAEEITSKMEELQNYCATAKTADEYAREREEALAARKAERLAEINVDRINQYRSAESTAIQAAQSTFRNAVNSATTIEAVNAVSRDSFDNLLTTSKTGAQYMLDEMYSSRDLSSWALVNQHAANYTHIPESNLISVPAGTGVDGVGYLMSPVKYVGAFELSMRLQASNPTTSTVGLMFGNYHDKATGDGIDGYLINYDIATDHQYVQIWFMNNAYCTYGDSVLEYIGGWVYNDAHTEGTLAERNIRVKYDGYNIKIMDDEEYRQFGDYGTVTITVPLMFNNRYAIEPSVKKYSFGFLNWDGNSLDQLRGIYLDELTVSASSHLCGEYVALSEIAKVNLSLYEDAEKTQLNAKIRAIRTAMDDYVEYDELIALVDELIALVATLKTHEELEIERHRDISVEMLDGIYSDDPTKHTPSNWDLVNEHGLESWTHEQGSHTVVTNGDAGYIMDADIHTNFTVVFKVTGTQAINPFNAAWPDSALIIGGDVSGNYFTGYEIVLSQDWGFQLYDSMTGANGDPGCYGDQFKGGFATNSEGVTYRLTVMNGILKVYVVDPATGNETQMTGVNGAFAEATEWNVGTLSGHFGIMDWGGATTYEILEFRDL